MNRLLSALLLGCLGLAATTGLAEAGDPSVVTLPDGPFGLTGSLETRYLALKEADVPLKRWVPVAEQTVAVGLMQIQLVDGLASPVTTSAGITTGFVFRGACHLSYRPPAGAEADNFRRGTGLD